MNDLLLDLYSQYWYSIYLYAKSVSCEVFLAEVDDPEYLRNIKDNITNHHKKYLNDFNKDMLSMSRLIDRLSSPIDIVGVDGDYYIKFIDEK